MKTLPKVGSPLRKVLSGLHRQGWVTPEQGISLHGMIYGRTDVSGVRNAYKSYASRGWLLRDGDTYCLSPEAIELLDGVTDDPEPPRQRADLVPPRTAFPFKPLKHVVPDYEHIRAGSSDLLKAKSRHF